MRQGAWTPSHRFASLAYGPRRLRRPQGSFGLNVRSPWELPPGPGREDAPTCSSAGSGESHQQRSPRSATRPAAVRATRLRRAGGPGGPVRAGAAQAATAVTTPANRTSTGPMPPGAGRKHRHPHMGRAAGDDVKGQDDVRDLDRLLIKPSERRRCCLRSPLRPPNRPAWYICTGPPVVHLQHRHTYRHPEVLSLPRPACGRRPRRCRPARHPRVRVVRTWAGRPRSVVIRP